VYVATVTAELDSRLPTRRVNWIRSWGGKAPSPKNDLPARDLESNAPIDAAVYGDARQHRFADFFAVGEPLGLSPTICACPAASISTAAEQVHHDLHSA